MTEHKYAEILRAIADGKQIQEHLQDTSGGTWWEDISSDTVLYFLASGYYNIEWFRVKEGE